MSEASIGRFARYSGHNGLFTGLFLLVLFKPLLNFPSAVCPGPGPSSMEQKRTADHEIGD